MKGRILLALVSVAIGALIAELLLAMLSPQVYRLPDVWTHDAQLGWSHRSGSEGHLVTPEFDVLYQIDDDGRRQHVSVSVGRRLQLYGDSFAEGWGVDVDVGLAARLESGLALSVHNYGTAGYGTDQELLLFAEQGAAEAPDIVLVLFYANDLWNNVSRRGIGTERGAKPFFRPGTDGGLRLMGTPIPAPAPRIKSQPAALAEHSHLWSLGRKAMAQESPVPAQQMRQFYGGLYGHDIEPYRPVWDLTESLLAEFARASQKAGAEFVVVYAPSIVQIEAENWRTKRDLHKLTQDYDLSQPNRQLQAIAKRQGIDFIDLTAAFKAAAGEQTLYFRDSHWNEAGHQLAAEATVSALVNFGYAEARSGVEMAE